jgi:hypothetical protein
MYTLGTAAKATGMAKSTIHRAIKRGIISARSTQDGRGYEIDPAELHRVYAPVALNGSAEESVERSATPVLNAELEIKLARAEAELEALRQLLEAERRRSEELRIERSDWKAQAERLALSAPAQQRHALWDWLRRFA